jgi:endonuclease/exonuclease/phosphatase family metal-dependent hydrolase
MKQILLFLLLLTTTLFSQTKIISWNLETFGKSKSNSEITFIANTVKDFDIVAIQEVVAGDGGAHKQSHTVFNPLKKMGYQSILVNQKTTLKQTVKNGEYLASEYDNLFYNTAKTNRIDKGIIPFYKYFISLKEARMISDHIPIWFEFSLN